MTECSSNEEQENQFSLSNELNLTLLYLSKNGKYDELKIFFEKYNPNKLEIDLAIRDCLYKFRSSDVNYCKTIKLLFKHADLNYCNPTFNNENLLMNICAKANIYLFDLIFGQNILYIPENNRNKNNKQINKNNIKENNTYVDINIYQVDKFNNNIFHYLFTDMNQPKEIIEAINKIMNYKGNNNNKIYSLEKKKYLFSQPNNEGITPIIIILKKGCVNVLSIIYKYIDYQKYIIPSSNNNLIHCAIEGKDIKCIKKILSYCNSMDELKFKNKEGYTPFMYAKMFEFYMIKKLMEEFESNIDNKEYKNILLSIKNVDIYDILGKYMIIRNNCYINSNIDSIETIIKRDYNSILYNLKKYEIENSIIDQNYFNLPCKWNILFSRIQMNQLLNYINNDKSKANFKNYLKQFSKFFKEDLKIEENEQYFINDIIIYNKLIYYYKLGNYSSLIDTIKFYFENIYQKEDNEYNYLDYITYVNIGFILIEYFIFDNDKILSEKLLNQLEIFLNNNIHYQRKYEANENIIKYLNNNEIFNPFNSTWDDAFGYINLLRIFYTLKFKIPLISNNSNKESKMNNTKKEIKEYLKIFEEKNRNCEKEELVNSNRLKGFATINKCYYYYLSNILNKSLKNLNLIKESLYNLNEYKIFYFNTLGIIYLKQKKYIFSEHLFKFGIYLFNQVSINNSGEDKIFYNFEYAIKMKYNLCLALFYNKKYSEAFLLFQEIQNCIIIKNNSFFWYRYGLTALNLYLFHLKKLNNEKEISTYNNNNQNNMFNEQSSKSISNDKYNNIENIDDNQSEKDDLFIEFEREYVKKENSFGNYNNISDKSNIKKILFPKYHSINHNVINNYTQNDSYGNNKKDTNSEKNIIKYLITSIKCFKKSIMLYKKQPGTIPRNEKMVNDINYIMNFYKIENKNNSDNKNSFYNFNDSNLSPISLFTLSYINLLFALSLNEKYNEVLLLIKVFPQKLLNNLEIKNKLDYYKYNAMLNLNKYKEAEEIINKNKKIENKNNSEINYETNIFDCFNTSGCVIESGMNHKTYLTLSEIYLDCRLKRYDKAEKNLYKLVKLKYDSKQYIPKYYNQLMLYILSLQNKEKNIINLIKYRWNQLEQKEKNKFIKIKNNDENG